jgi:RHS repeat-associated protein
VRTLHPRLSGFIALLTVLGLALVPTRQLHAQSNLLVGSLPGGLSVDNKGSANYSIPLKIAPGRGGMQPSVSLNYNSASGNGPLGIGWSLSTGFPQSITRGRSILARDLEVRGITFTSTDKFYLDGKRLIYISGGTGYGTPGSTYRTEVDSFVTVTTTGSGSNIETFTVTDKSGTCMTFGKFSGTTDGYQVGAFDADSNGFIGVGEVDTLAYAYAIKRVQDTIGNCVDFTYATANDGEYQLSQIDYTSLPGVASAQARVRFIYDLNSVAGSVSRVDQPTNYIAARRFNHKKRLDQVVGEFNSSGSYVVTSRFDLGYAYSPNYGPTRLMSLQARFANPTTLALEPLPPTTFTWDDKTFSYSTTSGTIVSNPGLGETWALGDVDGDGRVDLVNGNSSTFIMVSLGTASGFASPVSWTTAGLWTGSGGGFKLCDIDGDGKKDLIFNDGYVLNGSATLSAFRSTGSSFVPLAGGTTIYTFTTEFQDPGASTYNFRSREQESTTNRVTTGDFNGDGRDDILIHRYDGKLKVLLSTGTGFSAQALVDVGADSLWGTPNWELFAHRFLGFHMSQNFSISMMPCELNGDGRTDYAWVETEQSLDTWQAIGSGTNAHSVKTVYAVTSLPGGGFSQATQVGSYGWGVSSTNPSPIPYRQTSFYITPADVNGDGLTDFVMLTPGQIVAGDGGWAWHQQALLHRLIQFSKGSSGAPQFEQVTSSQTSVTISGQQIRPWFDKIAMGEWVNDHYNSIGQLTSAQMPIFMSAGLSSSADNIFMMDVNSDGKADYVWYVDAGGIAGWYAMISAGDGTFSAPVQIPLDIAPTPKLPPGAQGMTLSTHSPNDINGDGLPDFASAQGSFDARHGLGSLAMSAGKPGDRIVSITNGFGSETTIAYKPITDSSIYTSGATVSYPIRELRSASYVVADVWHDTGTGNTSDRAQFSYQYSGNRLDLSGRGSLGFHAFVTLDRQTNLFKYQFLAQSFPMTGLTHRDETYRWWNDGSDKFRYLSSHDNTVVFDRVSGGNGTLWPFISKATEYRWEDATTPHFTYSTSNPNSHAEQLFSATRPLSSAHIAITAESKFDNQSAVQTTLPGATGYYASDLNGTTNVVGGTTNSATKFTGLPGVITYGNLKELKTNYGNDASGNANGEKVINNYLAPTSNGITGRVQDTQTHAWGGGYGTEALPEKAPRKTYTYATINSVATPLVATELIEATTASPAGASTLNLTTTYTYDTRGRLTNTAISSPDPAIGGYSVGSITAFDDRWDLPTVTKNATGYLHTTTSVYHPFLGLPTSVTGPNGDVTTTTYDSLGRTSSVTNHLGLTTTSAWSFDGSEDVEPPSGVTGVTLFSAYKVVTATTVAPTTTTYYDRLGRVVRTKKEGFGSQVAVTDAVYNKLGQTVATTLPYPSGGTKYWSTTTYDPLGRVSTATAPNLTLTANTYNGRVTTVSVDAPSIDGVNPAAQVNSTLVDPKGRTVKVWNADNLAGSVNGQTGAGGNEASIEFKLDGFGRMRSTKLRSQTPQISATYDAYGRQLSLNDPDKGNWTYVNNALGQVVSQTDARGTITNSSFDRLGRPLTRVTTELNGPVEAAKWFYYDIVNDTGFHLMAKGLKGWIGALERDEITTINAPGYAASNSAAQNIHYYNEKGLPEIKLSQIDGKVFSTRNTYDTYWRPSQVKHHWKPAGAELPNQQPYVWEDFGYSYTYDGTGPSSKSYLVTLSDSLGRPWWSNPAYDHVDRVTSVQKGNGHTTTRTYRPTDGVLQAINTGGGAIQNLTFKFDGLGNLVQRAEGALIENFGYDNLNRLTQRGLPTLATIASYATNGNISTKVNVSGTLSGAYGYDANKPHAVASAWGYTMSYDANGNVSSRTKSGETWSFKYAGFDKPRWMAKTVGSVTAGSEFLYNANRSRTIQLEFDSMLAGAPLHYTRKRIYAMGPTLEVNYTNSVPTDSGQSWTLDAVRIYVPGPDGIIGAREFRPASGGSEKALVYHYDHLGSITSITDYGSTASSYSVASGNKTGRYSEDAWGQRRNPLTWSGAPPATTDDGGADSLTPRGFTGHEMLDDLGLVHMNGRIYDPLLGRFLSADPIVQFPGILQSYNRYSYVRNNPLSRLDPSGFAETFQEWVDKRKDQKDVKAFLASLEKAGVKAIVFDPSTGKGVAVIVTKRAADSADNKTLSSTDSAGIKAQDGASIPQSGRFADGKPNLDVGNVVINTHTSSEELDYDTPFPTHWGIGGPKSFRQREQEKVRVGSDGNLIQPRIGGTTVLQNMRVSATISRDNIHGIEAKVLKVELSFDIKVYYNKQWSARLNDTKWAEYQHVVDIWGARPALASAVLNEMKHGGRGTQRQIENVLAIFAQNELLDVAAESARRYDDPDTGRHNGMSEQPAPDDFVAPY